MKMKQECHEVTRNAKLRPRIIDDYRRDRVWIRIALALMLLTMAATSAAAKRASVATVPMELRGVHIFVDISINGKPATFVLDTGASANVITPDAVQRLHLTP